MRPAQITAINGIEKSLAEQRFSRSLVQMATGAGKTFTAVTECYRLLRNGGFTRVLFPVDRNDLADRTAGESQMSAARVLGADRGEAVGQYGNVATAR